MLHSYWLGAAFKKGFRRQISLGITKRRGAEIGTGWLRIRSLLTHIGAYSGSFLLPTLRLFSPDPVPQTQIWLIDRQRQTQSSKKAIFFKIDRGPVYHASHVVSNSPMAMSSIPYPDLSNLALLLKSWDATEPGGWVRKWLTLRFDLTDVTLVTWVKISTEDFTDETLAIDDTQGVDVNLI